MGRAQASRQQGVEVRVSCVLSRRGEIINIIIMTRVNKTATITIRGIT